MTTGILVVDKPQGFTSFDVVAKLRGICGTKKIGHGGTLDPMATGVLPVFVGPAAKAVDLMPRQDKAYEAELLLGLATDTGDITGAVLQRRAAAVSAEALAAVLPRFLGRQRQLPPMYSAVKVAGKPLYRYAREGKAVERKAREIEIFSLELMGAGGGGASGADTAGGSGAAGNTDAAGAGDAAGAACAAQAAGRGPDEESTGGVGGVNDAAGGGRDEESRFWLRVHCSKGTYIRTLVEDIGAALGLPATLAALRRTAAGPFGLAQAHPLAEIQRAKDEDRLGELFLPLETIFTGLPRCRLEEEAAERLKRGAPVYALPGGGYGGPGADGLGAGGPADETAGGAAQPAGGPAENRLGLAPGRYAAFLGDDFIGLAQVGLDEVLRAEKLFIERGER